MTMKVSRLPDSPDLSAPNSRSSDRVAPAGGRHDAGAAAPAYRIDDIIDRAPLGNLQKSAVALCCLVGIFNGFDAQLIGFLAPSIADTLHVDVRSLGPMFSASFLGLMLGALIMGPLGDRWGRKRIIVGSTLLFGVLAGATGFIDSLNQLIAVRFLTGLGLGGVLPNLAALATEYVPARLSRIPVCLISAAIPAGAMVAGLTASALLPVWGWRSMFYVGGAAPIAVAALLAVRLPESVKFLASKPGNETRVRAIMARIWPAAASEGVRFEPPRTDAGKSVPVAELFRHGRATMTAMLWIATVMDLLMLYFVVSWLPVLLKSPSLPASAGVMAITLFSLGGIVGSLAQGPLMNGLRPTIVLLAEFIIFIGLAVAMALAPLSYALAAIVAFVIGWAIQGSQAGLTSYTANLYPTNVRSTALGWCLGVGLCGSIIGPALGGLALQAGWTTQEIFGSGAIPGLIAVAAVSVIAGQKKHAVQ